MKPLVFINGLLEENKEYDVDAWGVIHFKSTPACANDIVTVVDIDKKSRKEIIIDKDTKEVKIV